MDQFAKALVLFGAVVISVAIVPTAVANNPAFTRIAGNPDYSSLSRAPAISDGNVVFAAVGPGGEHGIFASMAGSLQTVVRVGDPMPDTAFTFTFLNQKPQIDGTTIGFGGFNFGADHNGWYQTNPLHTIVDEHTPYPGSASTFDRSERECGDRSGGFGAGKKRFSFSPGNHGG